MLSDDGATGGTDQGVTAQLKSENQMQWVGMMNNIRHCAEEVVLKDIVYV